MGLDSRVANATKQDGVILSAAGNIVDGVDMGRLFTDHINWCLDENPWNFGKDTSIYNS